MSDMSDMSDMSGMSDASGFSDKSETSETSETSDSPATPPPTHVVTCFLLRRSDGTDGSDAILLVRRSERVRTYRGAWAGISGYLEPGVTPLAQAYTELAEEAALAPADVRLLRAGQPLPFRDEALGQSWVVHPFLFALAESGTVRTDWEAVEHAWVAPEQVRQLPTVPMLAEALARVYAPEGAG